LEKTTLEEDPQTMKKIIKLLYTSFPIFAGLTFFLIALETYTYIGFLKKYLMVDSRFFIMLTIIFAPFAYSVATGKHSLWVVLNNLLFKINQLVFPLSLIAYLVMQSLESYKFHNYVFSTYHLQPNNFFYLVVLSGGLILVKKVKIPIIKLLIVPNNLNNLGKFIRICIVSVFTFLLIDNFAISVNQAIGSDMYILLHPLATYDQKMQNYWGFFYDYIMFVKNNTPEHSTVMIPPKESPWLSTGNESLVRYFLYPRNLVQGTKGENIKLDGVDYILMAWGEWTVNDATKYGWPKIQFSNKDVIYFGNSKNWGLIKIKK
jgi:hypothetical protein